MGALLADKSSNASQLKRPVLVNQNAALQDDQPGLSREQIEELEDSVRTKTLHQLMELRGKLHKEAQDSETGLRQVTAENQASLIPHTRPSSKPPANILAEDSRAAEIISSTEHLRAEHFAVKVKPDEDPQVVLQTQKQRMKELLPNLRTDAVLLRGDDGTMYVGMLGVSAGEAHAAVELRANQRQASLKSDMLEARIRQQVSEEVASHSIGRNDAQDPVRGQGANAGRKKASFSHI